MPVQKFEAQPYYQDAIYDERVLTTLGLLAVANNERAKQDEDARSRASWPGSTEEPPKPIERFKVPYTHTVDLIDSSGSDGESYSGGISFLEVTTSEGQNIAAIYAGLYSHDTGLPAHDSSWSAEFKDIALAKSFWKNHWQPNFSRTNFIRSANEFIKDRNITDPSSIRFQDLGLLAPWYVQKTDQLPLLNVFATAHNALVHVPRHNEPAPNLNPGQVYKVPSQQAFDYATGKFEAKTCLAAFKTTWRQTGGWTSSRSESYLAIQWSDGDLAYYRHTDQNLPAPLLRKDIARAKPVASAAHV